MTVFTYLTIFLAFFILLFTGVLFLMLDWLFYGIVNLGRLIYEAIV